MKKGSHHSPESLARMSARQKQDYAGLSPEEYARRTAARWTPEARARQSEDGKKRWANPEYKNKQSEAVKSAFRDPARKERLIQGIRNALTRPEVIERRNAAAKARWADPKARQRASKAATTRFANPAERERASKAATARYANPTERELSRTRNVERWNKSPELREQYSKNLTKLWALKRAVTKGRPRKDAIRARVIELKAQGKSMARIKTQIDHETGKLRSLRTYRQYLEKS
jgi:hypothetical protein